jgi:acyl-CoA reductase-like NAD-dependent aldehyde dehydrogenase
VTRSAAARIPPYEPRVPDRTASPKPARNNMLAKFTREARERLGPDATEREVARAAESAHKAFYKRLSAAGVAARKAALLEALMRQRRAALAFAIVEDQRAARAGSPGSTPSDRAHAPRRATAR